MRVLPEQLSVQFGSYPDGGRGNPARRSSGDNGLRLADPANLRAATCSESRAGSESTVVTPTRHLCGEGRSITQKQPIRARVMVTGVVGAARREGFSTQRGRPGCGAGLRPATASSGCRPCRDSERPIVPAKSGNADGGKGPHFGNAFEEGKGAEIGASLQTPSSVRRLRKKLGDQAKQRSGLGQTDARSETNVVEGLRLSLIHI